MLTLIISAFLLIYGIVRIGAALEAGLAGDPFIGRSIIALVIFTGGLIMVSIAYSNGVPL